MSRIHAFLIALFVTGAIAVGVATAFTVAGSSGGAGSELNSEVLQKRADRINEAEKRIAKTLADNPKPDRSPIIRVRTAANGGSSAGAAAATASTTTTRSDDDDDRGRNRGPGGGDDRSGSSGSGGGDDESDDD